MTSNETDEAINNYKEICCENIPELFLDKLIARQHFSQFGNISRVILRPRRHSCTVAFETEEEARRAFLNGGNYHGHKFTIKLGPEEQRYMQNNEDWVNADVQAELEAISNVRRTELQTTQQRSMQRLVSPQNLTSPPPPAPLVAPKKATPELRAVNSNLKKELMSIMKRPAYTTEEKYRILDARDKLVRSAKSRRHDIDNSKVTKGYCPDMCPEKERLLREFQRQVSSFELADSHEDAEREQKISHKHAIKEYSRSSADQESPLAHELRSEESLGMTMAYMLHRIVDLCDDSQTSPGDWFHFVWDRFRAIRKDIAQQELCSLNAVRLVEQCARFHIHCRARLVAEEPSVFDKKINADNLQKCLQSLKYMYHDLRLDNIVCPCEPEFWSYVILLNLANANFVWEINQLPEYIQQSRDVRRATNFFYALQDNNYVRFFRMVRETETTYLMSCILLGYFQELRLRALEIITKAHKGPKGMPTLPLAHIAHILAFESEQKASDFLEYYGLTVDGKRVYLEQLTKPETEYKMERAKQLVESKRLVSVGECICGEPLPSEDVFELHIPHNSFNEFGVLKSEAWYAEDQVQGNTDVGKIIDSDEETEINPTVVDTPPKLLRQPTSDGIFKMPRCSPPISPKQQPYRQQSMLPSNGFGMNDKMSTIQQTTPPSNDFGGNIFDLKMSATKPPMQQPTSSIFSSGNSFQAPFGFNSQAAKGPNRLQDDNAAAVMKAFAEQRASAESEQRAKEEAARQKRLKDEADHLARQEAEMHAREAAEATERAERQRLKAEQLKAERIVAFNRKAEEIYEYELWKVLLPQQIAEVAHEVYERALRQHCSTEALTRMIYDTLIRQTISSELKEHYAAHHYERKMLAQCFRQWSAYTRRRQCQRQVYNSTAYWLPTETHSEQAENLMHDPYELNGNLNMIRRYRQGNPVNFKALLEISRKDDTPFPHEKLNLWKLLANKLPSYKVGEIKYCKLLFSLPDQSEGTPGFTALCEKWLKSCLVQQRKTDEDDIAYINDVVYNVALCVRKIRSAQPPLNERNEPASLDELSSSDGVVCFMTPSTAMAMTAERLRIVCRGAASVAFVVFDCEHIDAATLERQLQPKVNGCQRYAFFGCEIAKSRFNFVGLLRHAVEFIARQLHYSEDELLEQQAVGPFLEIHLGTELWNRWLYTGAHNAAFRKSLCESPSNIVVLYNSAITRLQSIAAEDLRQERLFPHELRRHVPKEHVTLDMPLRREYFIDGWHTPQNNQQIVQLLESAMLPNLKAFSPPTSTARQGQLEDALYLWLLDYGSVCMFGQEERSLQVVYTAIHTLARQINGVDLQEAPLEERLQMVNYLEVIKEFALERLKLALLQNQDYPSAIVYRRSKILAYREQPWWLNLGLVTACKLSNKAVTTTYDNNNTTDSLASFDERDNATPSTAIPLTKYEDIVTRAEAVVTRRRHAVSPPRIVPKRKALSQRNIVDMTRQLDMSITQFEEINEQCDDVSNTENDMPTTERLQKRFKFNNANNKSCSSESSIDDAINSNGSATKSSSPSLPLSTENLKESIDEAIERASKLISHLDEIDDVAKRRFFHSSP